ncbi:MAG: hypothetical protein HY774_07140 [Acidobacteria bacterium]|nr:hypothetical protein [Acidobacteriota bacterium]
MDQLENQSLPPTTQLELFPQPDTGRQPIIDLINSATRTIDAEMDELTDLEALSALKTAAQRGVQVRVLLAPKLRTGESNFDLYAPVLQAAGIEAKPTPAKFDTEDSLANARFLVLDQSRLLVGTTSFSVSGLGDFTTAAASRSFWLLDPRPEVVAEAQALFNADWAQEDLVDGAFQALTVTPENSHARILGFIHGVQRVLYIYTQEMSLENVTDALISARNTRCVDVRVLVSDHSTANQTTIQQLQSAGIPAYPYTRYALAANAFLADGQLFIGSQTFTYEGFFTNRELGELVTDEALVDQFTDLFLVDFEFSSAMAVTADGSEPSQG